MWDLAPHTRLYLKCAVHTDKKFQYLSVYCIIKKKNRWLAPTQFVALIIQLESFKSLLTYSAERCSSVKNIFFHVQFYLATNSFDASVFTFEFSVFLGSYLCSY